MDPVELEAGAWQLAVHEALAQLRLVDAAPGVEGRMRLGWNVMMAGGAIQLAGLHRGAHLQWVHLCRDSYLSGSSI